MHDWDLKTNIDAYFLRLGDQLFASDCCGFAATATGYYAGRKAMNSTEGIPEAERTSWRQKRRKNGSIPLFM